MALFENYDRRIGKINGVLAEYGIASVEEAREICVKAGFDPYEIAKGIQPICFEKVGLKLNIQKTKIMVSGPITSWQIDGETVETVSDFIFGGAPKSLQMVIAAMELKDAYSLEGKL